MDSINMRKKRKASSDMEETQEEIIKKAKQLKLLKRLSKDYYKEKPMSFWERLIFNNNNNNNNPSPLSLDDTTNLLPCIIQHGDLSESCYLIIGMQGNVVNTTTTTTTINDNVCSVFVLNKWTHIVERVILNQELYKLFTSGSLEDLIKKRYHLPEISISHNGKEIKLKNTHLWLPATLKHGGGHEYVWRECFPFGAYRLVHLLPRNKISEDEKNYIYNNNKGSCSSSRNGNNNNNNHSFSLPPPPSFIMPTPALTQCPEKLEMFKNIKYDLPQYEWKSSNLPSNSSSSGSYTVYVICPILIKLLDDTTTTTTTTTTAAAVATTTTTQEEEEERRLLSLLFPYHPWAAKKFVVVVKYPTDNTYWVRITNKKCAMLKLLNEKVPSTEFHNLITYNDVLWGDFVVRMEWNRREYEEQKRREQQPPFPGNNNNSSRDVRGDGANQFCNSNNNNNKINMMDFRGRKDALPFNMDVLKLSDTRFYKKRLINNAFI